MVDHSSGRCVNAGLRRYKIDMSWLKIMNEFDPPGRMFNAPRPEDSFTRNRVENPNVNATNNNVQYQHLEARHISPPISQLFENSFKHLQLERYV